MRALHDAGCIECGCVGGGHGPEFYFKVPFYDHGSRVHVILLSSFHRYPVLHQENRLKATQLVHITWQIRPLPPPTVFPLEKYAMLISADRLGHRGQKCHRDKLDAEDRRTRPCQDIASLWTS
jgi:hypothetical protein